VETIKEKHINSTECTTDLIDEINPQVKYVLKFTIEHYLIITSFLAFIFSVICYIRTTEYFEEWGINFFDYASLSDLYVVSLKAGIASIALKFTGLIAVTAAVSTTLLRIIISFTYNKQGKVSRSSLLIPTVIILMITAFSSTYESNLITSPDNIEQFPRVNVDLRWGDSMQCVSVIAGVSDYLFVWDFETSKPTAISRINVTKVEYKIEQQPPLIRLILKDKSGKRLRQRNPKRTQENQKDLAEWEAKLSKVCNQKLSND